jgi:hypothetical protein
MIEALRTLQGRFIFEVSVVEVDSDAALEARYGERVPVLTVSESGNERELCHYFLDKLTVTAFLEKMR